MSDDRVAPETKGVTVKLLATVDLGPEIEGMAGRQARSEQRLDVKSSHHHSASEVM